MKKMRNRCLSVLVGCLITLFPSFGEEVLSNQHVNSIEEDNLGYIWIGTARGLCKYNGYEYQYYMHSEEDPNSLPIDFINCVKRDKYDRLWISTHNQICYYQPQTNDFRTIKTPKSEYNNKGLYVHDSLLIAYGQGFRIINTRTLSTTLFPQFAHLEVNSVFVKHNKLFLCCDQKQGIVILTLQGKKLKTVRAPAPNCVFKFSPQEYWVGTDNGLVAFDPMKDEPFSPSLPKSITLRLQGLHITTICRLNKDIILIGTKNKGLFIYDEFLNTFDNCAESKDFPAFSAHHITCSFKDSQGNVWIGSFDQGYQFYSSNTTQFNQDDYLNALVKGKFISSVTKDHENHLWISTRYNGIYSFNPTDKSNHHYSNQNAKGDFTQCLYFSGDKLWFDDGDYLCAARVSGGRMVSVVKYALNSYTSSITSDDRGNMWIGTNGQGIYRITPAGKLEHINYQGMKISKGNAPFVGYLSNRKVIFSSYLHNIYLLDPVTLQTQALTQDPQLIAKLRYTITIYEGMDKKLYIGTYGYGMFVYDPQKDAFTQYDTHQGLPSNDVLGFAPGKNGDIWISTSFGLTCFMPLNGEFKNLLQEASGQGIQFHEKCVYHDRLTNKLYFGGNQGLTYFNPYQLKDSGPLISVNIEKVHLLPTKKEGEEKTLFIGSNTEPVVLRYNQNIFRIDYAGINYSSSQLIQYRHRLLHLNSTWINNHKTRNAIYSNVPAGEYTFEVQAQNSMGEWGPSKQITIVVKPAPWRTIWAYLLYAIIIGVAVLFSNRLYINYKMNQHKAILSERELERDKEATRLKIRFFTNISHELRTLLTLIHGPVKELIYSFSNKSDSEQYLLQLVNQNTVRILRLIDQLCDFSRIENDTLCLKIQKTEIIAPIQQIISSYSFYAQEKKIELLFDTPVTSLEINTDLDKIDAILNNLLSNSFKYTQEGGRIIVELRILKDSMRVESNKDYQGEYLSLAVRDTGIGVDPQDLPKLFNRYNRLDNNKKQMVEGSGIGLHYVKRLVDMHQGEVSASTEEPHGLRVTVVLPTELQPNEDLIAMESYHDIYFEAEEQEAEEPVNELEETETQENPSQKKRILIVEDNLDVQHYLRKLLEKDYLVQTAHNGQEGYEKACHSIPDLIISDVMMPVMNGYELCHKIKSNEQTSHIIFIILTAKTSEENHEEGYKEGADHYLNKPFSPSKLQYLIKNTFNTLVNQQQLFYKGSTLIQEEESEENYIHFSALDRKFLNKLNEYIEENIDSPLLDVSALYTKLGYSRTNFYRKINSLTGQTPSDYIKIYRLKYAVTLIKSQEYTLSEISDKTGFSALSHFSSSFKKQYGVSPREYMKQMKEKEEGSIA